MATPHLHEADERGEAVAKLGQVRVEAALVLAAEAGGEREDDTLGFGARARVGVRVRVRVRGRGRGRGRVRVRARVRVKVRG